MGKDGFGRVALLLGRGSAAGAVALLLIGLSAAGLGGRGDRLAGPVPARVIAVVDGDTLAVKARIWLGQEVETLVRLAGVDAPELDAPCQDERLLAARARDLLQAMIGGHDVVLTDIRYGKYAGRVIARVLSPEGEDFATSLIAAGLGRPYEGGSRPGWCPDGETTS